LGFARPFGLQQLRDLALEFQPSQIGRAQYGKTGGKRHLYLKPVFCSASDLASGHINHFGLKRHHDRRVPSKTMISLPLVAFRIAQFIAYCRVADGAGAPKKNRNISRGASVRTDLCMSLQAYSRPPVPNP